MSKQKWIIKATSPLGTAKLYTEREHIPGNEVDLVEASNEFGLGHRGYGVFQWDLHEGSTMPELANPPYKGVISDVWLVAGSIRENHD